MAAPVHHLPDSAGHRHVYALSGRSLSGPSGFSTTQSAWSREFQAPWVVIGDGLERLGTTDLRAGELDFALALDLTAFFMVLAISGFVWHRLGASYGLYSLICVLIPASTETISLSRYVLVIFPMFMMLGHWGRNALLDRALLITFSVLLGVLTAAFVNWIFVA
ncbi:MAG: hypothetical protein HC915_09605 [Anaerolineae bacterium]|nr:hypothetical protein [Anaerolineae bacterium]